MNPSSSRPFPPANDCLKLRHRSPNLRGKSCSDCGLCQELRLRAELPIHYRVRDAVSYLRRAGDVRTALEALGYRELLALTNTHTAFGLMTSDRVEITDQLRANLQRAM